MNAMFIVLWTVSLFVSDPCPAYKPDPYTGEFPSWHCAVNHGHVETKEMRREFMTRPEAEAFIKAGKGRDIEFKLIELTHDPK